MGKESQKTYSETHLTKFELAELTWPYQICLNSEQEEKKGEVVITFNRTLPLKVQIYKPSKARLFH